jgi:hypothetical protein
LELREWGSVKLGSRRGIEVDMPDRPLTRGAREARDNISTIADSYVVAVILAVAVVAGLLLFVGSAMFNTGDVNTTQPGTQSPQTSEQSPAPENKMP